ncbi:MAG: P-loop NTPase fold protein [Cyanobacteria bacterium J06638_28]
MGESPLHVTGQEWIEERLAAIEAAIQDPQRKIEALVNVASESPLPISKAFQQALTVTETLTDEGSKAFALRTIAPHLPTFDTALLRRAFDVIDAIKSDENKVFALKAIAPQLPKSDRTLLERALVATQSIKDDRSKAEVLGAIAPHVPEPERDRVLESALTASEAIINDEWKVLALLEIAPYFSESNQKVVLERAFTVTEEIRYDHTKAKTLSAIAAHLPAPERTKVLDQALTIAERISAAEAITNDSSKGFALRAIASRMHESDQELLERALAATETITGDTKASALNAIAPHLPEPRRTRVLEQALTLAEAMADTCSRLPALCQIASSLHESDQTLLERALAAAESITDTDLKAKVLHAIAPKLPDAEILVLQFPRDQFSRVLGLVRVQANDALKVRLLSAAAPHLSVGLLPAALQIIAQGVIKHEALRVEALSNLVPYLPAEQLTIALDLCQIPSDTLETNNYQAFIHQAYRAKALTQLLPDLVSLDQYETACSLIETAIPKSAYRAAVLTILATALATDRVARLVANTPQKINLSKVNTSTTPTERLTTLVDQIWNMLQGLEGDQQMCHRADILCRLIPAMPITQIDDQVLPNLKSLFRYQTQDPKHPYTEDTGHITQVLFTIAQRRLPDFKNDPAANVKVLNSQELIANDFLGQVKVLSLLPGNEAIKRVKQISFPRERAEAWVEIACHSEQDSHQYQALQLINSLSNDDYHQSKYLLRLVPHLRSPQRFEAARVAKEIKQDYYCAEVLVALACKFPIFRPEAKTTAQALSDTVQKVKQLSLLAVEVPELLPEIITIAEGVKESAKRKWILEALAPHLPIRIDNEVNRNRSADCSEDLWQRALYLLARNYRDALKGGSLRSESTQADDLLNLKDEVDALADMLLMRDLEPPMTVGILGGWGGGKSYIMHLMQTAMTHVRSRKVEAVETWNPDSNSEKLSPYVGHIYQIKFDAWTFAKSNLWASLMQTIFFELNRQISLEQQLSYVLANDPDNEDDRRQALCESGNYWAVLYKTDEADRQNFLERVLPARLEQLKAIQNQGKFEDELWQQFGDTYRDESQKLADLQQALAAKTQELIERKQTITESVEDALINQVLQSPAIAPVAAILSRRISEKSFKHLTTEIKEAIAEQIKRDEHAQQAIATTDTEQLKAIVKAITIRVIERRAGQLDFTSFLTWFKRNLRLFGLLFFFLLLALLLPIAVEQLLGWVLPSVDALIARAIAFLVPLTPGIATAQNLLQGARKWLDETHLAVKEYETQLQAIPEQLEARQNERIQTTIEQDPQALELEAAIQTLQQKIAEQAQRIPHNVYASLEEFVSDRLQSDSYNRHLGIMHQVKDDLTDLSRRLLPPPATSQEFQAKLGQLQKIFPRGPARVVVYIDDLDRCPPKRVVEVLEAVQLLVKTPLFIAVLAIDERYITRALEKYYDGVLSRRGRPSGTDYLEKIIQLPYRVRPITPSALETYLKAQVVLQDSGTSGSKFSEFSRQEFDMLLRCCRQTHLSPRTLKRLTNVYKLFKVVCRTRGTKPSPQVQQAILGLLALSGRYPDLMRSIFDIIEVCYEEARTQAEVDALMEDPQKRAWAEKQGRLLHLDSPLVAFFRQYSLPASDRYLQREFDKLQHDALETGILPPSLTLKAMTHEIFNLIRSFSFVGEIGEDPEDYRFSGPIVADSSLDT